MPTVDINWVALIVATIINMVVGFVWYSPALFAKPWAKLTGRKMDEMGDGNASSYALTTLGAFVQAFILLHFVTYAKNFYPESSNLEAGIMTGLMAWIAFTFVPQFVNGVFAATRKKLLAINSGYFLVVLVVNGILLASWV